MIINVGSLESISLHRILVFVCVCEREKGTPAGFRLDTITTGHPCHFLCGGNTSSEIKAHLVRSRNPIVQVVCKQRARLTRVLLFFQSHPHQFHLSPKQPMSHLMLPSISPQERLAVIEANIRAKDSGFLGR